MRRALSFRIIIGLRWRRRITNKSFLLLFYKKEALAFLPSRPRDPPPRHGAGGAGGAGEAEGQAGQDAGGEEAEALGFECVAVPADGFHGFDGDAEAGSEQAHDGGVVAAAAGDEHAFDRAGQAAGGDGGGGEGGQGGGAVGGGEGIEPGGGQGAAEIQPIERFGSGAGEVGVGEQVGEHRGIRRALGGEGAIGIDGEVGVFGGPVIEGAVAGAGIEGEEAAMGADPGDVGDAADVQHAEGFFEGGGEGLVEDGDQRRPLAAGGDIGRAEIVGDGGVGGAGQGGGVADLPGEASVGLVEDGLAVEADEIGGFGEGGDGFDVALGEAGGDVGEEGIGGGEAGGEVEQAAEIAAQGGVVGEGESGAEAADLGAVGFEPGGVHPVERGAAHEADGAEHFHGRCFMLARRPLKTGNITMPTAEFLHEARARGFVFQCTDDEGLESALKSGVVSGYIGFDCTADSLHVGSMVSLMLLRLMQRHGHRPMPLIGGGTTKIGDPSFREEARQLLTDEQIAVNKAGIRRNIEKLMHFGDGPTDAVMPDNAEWLEELSYIRLLREVGVHFSVNRMLGFDSVKSRLEREQGLTFLEFNYSILQSYDFRELNRRYGVTLQMGGSDQWGNIVSGIDLCRRTDGKTVFGLTTPLIATASGAKMGKTAKGAVWLSEERVPVFDYWQYWRNTEDADVGRFLKLFTDLPLGAIARLEALGGAEINEAKKVLATEATAILHGRAKAEAAAETARAQFEGGGGADVPRVGIAASELGEGGVPVFRLLVLAGLAATGGEARRLIRGGGARLDDVVVKDEAVVVGEAALREGVRLSSGRKTHRLVQIEG